MNQTRRGKLEEKEISPSSEDLRVRSAVVMALTPPSLKYCDNLLSLLLFLEKYDDYHRLGGEISLFHCAYDVVKSRLDTQIVGRSTSSETLSQALIDAFKPRSMVLLLDLLRRIQIRNQNRFGNTLNIDAIIFGTKLFVAILSSTVDIVLSKQVMVEILLQKIENLNFRNYLVTAGIRETAPTDWPVFIRERAREFNEVNLAADVMGISEGKSVVHKGHRLKRPNGEDKMSADGIVKKSPESNIGSRSERGNKSCHNYEEGLPS